MSAIIRRNKERFKTLLRYRDLLSQLVARDIKLKYRRSYLGYLWSVLSPLMVMVVMTVVFSTMFNHKTANFPVYLLGGNLVFSFMRESSSHAITSITGNASLLKKVYVPKYIFTLSKVTSDLVNLFFSLGALVIVMLATGVSFHWTFFLIIVPILELYAFCVGLGMMLAAVAVFFRDVQYIWGVVLTAWMYLTPIFYPVEALPDKLEWLVTRLNPMYYYVTVFRDYTWGSGVAWTGNILRGGLIAALMLLIGTAVFARTKDRFILHI